MELKVDEQMMGYLISVPTHEGPFFVTQVAPLFEVRHAHMRYKIEWSEARQTQERESESGHMCLQTFPPRRPMHVVGSARLHRSYDSRPCFCRAPRIRLL